jgi:hypothetical protein
MKRKFFYHLVWVLKFCKCDSCEVSTLASLLQSTQLFYYFLSDVRMCSY